MLYGFQHTGKDPIALQAGQQSADLPASLSSSRSSFSSFSFLKTLPLLADLPNLGTDFETCFEKFNTEDRRDRWGHPPE